MLFAIAANQKWTEGEIAGLTACTAGKYPEAKRFTGVGNPVNFKSSQSLYPKVFDSWALLVQAKMLMEIGETEQAEKDILNAVKQSNAYIADGTCSLKCCNFS